MYEYAMKITTTSMVSANIISIFSHAKKGRYNVYKLYQELVVTTRKLNRKNSCHLTTYPKIAVHVTNTDSQYLISNHELIKNNIEKVLWDMQE